MPDLYDLVPVHSGQVEKLFGQVHYGLLLVPGQEE